MLLLRRFNIVYKRAWRLRAIWKWYQTAGNTAGNKDSDWFFIYFLEEGVSKVYMNLMKYFKF